MAAAPALRFDPAREEAELAAYLGEDYDRSRLEQHRHQLAEELAEVGDEGRFYRVSRGYLYDLTAFAMSETKLPYLRLLTRHVPAGSRILDYGCGIGSDGLALLEAGYRVEFADFDNPSVEYLRWRLRERGLEAPVHDVDGDVPGGFDLAYALDVIEHVDDPAAFCGELERRARLVMVNLLEPARGDHGGHGDPHVHRELPIAGLIRRADERPRRLLDYRLFHDRSHLLVYSTAAGGMGERLRSAPARQRAARAARALA